MIGVIADDLTGAAELGGIALRYGLKAELSVRPQSLNRQPSTALLCLDADSRSSTPTAAARLAGKAAAALSKLRPRWIYKKVDSVLRGNVLSEIMAIMRALGFRRALLSPANPSFGRVIRDGKYYVKGKLITETDFARDPEYPRRSSDARALLGAGAADSVRVIKAGQAIPETGIALAEVSSPADVTQWAEQISSDILCAGGAEFFSALLTIKEKIATAARQADRQPNTEQRVAAAIPELFVCGSISDATQKFVSESQSAGLPVFYLAKHSARPGPPRGLESMARKISEALASFDRVVLTSHLPVVRNLDRARQITLDLVRVARLVFERHAVPAFYVEGGATAAAFVRELGWTHFEVIAELAPGVITLRPKSSQALLTVKPGSYPGWPPGCKSRM